MRAEVFELQLTPESRQWYAEKQPLPSASSDRNPLPQESVYGYDNMIALAFEFPKRKWIKLSS